MRHILIALLLATTACTSDTTDPPPPCPTGHETCACHSDGSCNTGLVCASNICVRLAGDPVGGDPIGGDPVAGDPTAGDTPSGDPLTGDPLPGDTLTGDPPAGDPLAGDPNPGDTVGGDPGVIDPPPAPWDTLTWELTEIDVGNPTLQAGVQNRMIRKPNGDIHIAYFKILDAEATCNIAVFGGGPAPMPHLELRVATLLNGATDWTIDQIAIETLELAAPGYATARYGLDATLDSSSRLVVALAAGGPGLAQCGSTDAVTCTRASEGSWSCDTVATNSSECCQTRSPGCVTSGDCELDWCGNPLCTTAVPGDVGAWSAIATADNGTLGVAFTDFHNFWDQDGQNHQGLEFTEGSGVTGIRPWSSQGRYAALTYDANTPVVAFTSYTQGGLNVLRRPTTNGDGNDWVSPASGLAEWDGFEIGERIQLENAPNGTLGILFHAFRNRENIVVNDLAYCTSSDGGVNWGFPCKKLVTNHIGSYPGLAYDSDSIPYVAYRYCGTSECPASEDGVRMAWFDATQPSGGKWWQFIVHNDASNRSGLYNQIVVDPATKEPTIAFQHLTRGSLVVARGSFD